MRQGTLGGIACSFDFIPGHSTNVLLKFLPVQSKSTLMKRAADGLFHVLDISEKCNTQLQKNLVFKHTNYLRF